MIPEQKPQHVVSNDEIDLFELAEKLWEERWIIALVTAVVGFAALLYALFATPQYQTQSTLRPVAIKSLDKLNRLDIINLKPVDALARVTAELESYDTRFGFYSHNRDLFKALESDALTLEQNFHRINDEALSLIRPDPKRDEGRVPFITLRMAYPQGVDGPTIVNAMVAHAIERATDDVIADVDALVANRLAVLEREIYTARASYMAEKEVQIAHLTESDKLKKAQLQDELQALRNQLRQRRENRIEQLKEAISIASALGIRKPTSPSSMGQERSSGNVVRTEVTNQAPPLYFMGTEALEAERKALQSRESDDFTEPRIVEINKELQLLEINRKIETLEARENEDLFLAELARLRAERARLKALQVNPDKLKLARVDQIAAQPAAAMKPQKAMVVVIGLILGALLGAGIALARVAIKFRQGKSHRC